jgi:2-polyprenyl-3-methyl-5-hydroxy-6-metoxy-1,4-benzoquinol methylase
LASLLDPGSVIADLGCGDGRDTIFLLEQGFNVNALDLANNAILRLRELATSRQRTPYLTATVGSVLDWAPSVSSLDGVIGITILDHVSSEEHDAIIRKIWEALKPNGVVALEMHSDRDPVAGEHTSAGLSEFSEAIKSVATSNYLLSKFVDRWRILYYSDRIEDDLDHGEPHQHGFVSLLAQKV